MLALSVAIEGFGATDVGVGIEVRNPGVPVSDWIAQVQVDLSAAARLFGNSFTPGEVSIRENGRPVPCQVDSDGDSGNIVSFVVPGELAGGAVRQFELVFERGEAAAPAATIKTESTGDIVTIANGPVVIEHHKSNGGFPIKAIINGVAARFSHNDKIYDGTYVNYLAHHSADSMKILASGPLRAVCETEGTYAGSGGTESNPRALYRFTYYAGQPVTRVQAVMTQDFAKQWKSLHFIEIQMGKAPFKWYATDGPGGELKRAGTFYSGRKWAAAYGDDFMVGTLACPGVGVYDGGGKHYGGYVRGGTRRWSSLRYTWQGAILWGGGRQDIKTIQRWNEILANPPVATVRLPQLDDKIEQIAKKLAAKRLAMASLSGDAWAAAHVGTVLADSKLATATEAIGTGRYGDVLEAIASCEAALSAEAGQVKLKRAGGVEAGTVNGHPYIANAHAAYLFAEPAHGGGLINIHDRKSQRNLLKVDPRKAPLWQVAVKHTGGGSEFDNKSTPCRVTTSAEPRQVRLTMQWQKDIAVTVEAVLSEDDALLQCRLRVDTKQPDHGLLTVTFPVIAGILPLGDTAADDTVLETWGLGWQKPSPLHSGNISSTAYPVGMQFSALIGNGQGLYVAEQDPTAARKAMTWAPDTAAGTLEYTVAHPVLNWGADKLVHNYELPGDAVIGPFAGDWFDAAQIYRKWALTAPWCRKGPIHQRKDYPQWLAKAPYFTIGYLGDEHNFEREIKKHEYYDLPVHIAHTYDYYFSISGEDRYPEYFPPKLGSVNFKRAVEQWQSRGIRVVPYVNGQMWDADTESYRVDNAARDGALLNKEGKPSMVYTSYGGGQALVGMCPRSPLWRKTMLDVSKELVGRYGVDGIYYDFFTIHTNDCYNKEHGHAICGGDFWARSIHDFYEMLRTELKKLNPDVMLTGEDWAEWTIDVLDTGLEMNKAATNAPLLHAVYHSYANVFGGHQNATDRVLVGRHWLLGGQNGWFGPELAYASEPYAHIGLYYRKLLRCHWEFAQPYLSYGRMLRPPKISGDLPIITRKTGYADLVVAAVEANAWLAPDGSVGVFFLNYTDEPHEFEWTADLAEIANLTGAYKLKITSWAEGKGESQAGEIQGGVIIRNQTIEPWGMIALKLEQVQ